MNILKIEQRCFEAAVASLALLVVSAVALNVIDAREEHLGLQIYGAALTCIFVGSSGYLWLRHLLGAFRSRNYVKLFILITFNLLAALFYHRKDRELRGAPTHN